MLHWHKNLDPYVSFRSLQFCVKLKIVIYIVNLYGKTANFVSGDGPGKWWNFNFFLQIPFRHCKNNSKTTGPLRNFQWGALVYTHTQAFSSTQFSWVEYTLSVQLSWTECLSSTLLTTQHSVLNTTQAFSSAELNREGIFNSAEQRWTECVLLLSGPKTACDQVVQ